MKGKSVKAFGALRGSFVVLAAAAVLAVSGCATADTAAVVNGSRITERELQEAVRQLNTAVPNANLGYADALTLLLRAPFTTPVANSSGKGVSDSQVMAALGTEDLNPAAMDIVRTSDAFNPQSPTVLTQEEQNKVLTHMEKADITLNPRFGHFDAKKFSVDSVVPDWIMVEPTPAPKG